MLKDFAVLACGSVFTGDEWGFIFPAFVCLLLAAIMALTNIILLGVLDFRDRRGLGWHLLAWFAYVGAGILIVTRSLSFPTFALLFKTTCVLAIIIGAHLISLILMLMLLRHRSNSEQHTVVSHPRPIPKSG